MDPCLPVVICKHAMFWEPPVFPHPDFNVRKNSICTRGNIGDVLVCRRVTCFQRHPLTVRSMRDRMPPFTSRLTHTIKSTEGTKKNPFQSSSRNTILPESSPAERSSHDSSEWVGWIRISPHECNFTANFASVAQVYAQGVGERGVRSRQFRLFSIQNGDQLRLRLLGDDSWMLLSAGDRLKSAMFSGTKPGFPILFWLTNLEAPFSTAIRTFEHLRNFKSRCNSQTGRKMFKISPITTCWICRLQLIFNLATD